MPTITLTDRTVAGLKPHTTRVDYFCSRLAGFGVRVAPSGRKTFQLCHRVNGRFQRLTLKDPETDVATYPALTLAKARELALAALTTADKGHDPVAERKLSRERTFGALADLYLEQHAKRKKRSWRDDARMVRRELEAWRDVPAMTLRRADVRDLLEAIVQRGAPVLANRVLALVRKILNFGLDREWVEVNVATRMARPAAEASRDRVLAADELRTVWAWLEGLPKSQTDATEKRLATLNAAVLKLRLITAQRGGEVVDMLWSHVDLEAGWWTIPAATAKNKLAHRVPLSATAVDILGGLLQEAVPSAAYVFQGVRGTRHRRGVMAEVSVENLRPHDFRRTAASLMAGGGIPRLTIAKVLNHADRTVTSIYDRHGYDAEKRAALDWWSIRLAALVAHQEPRVLTFQKQG